MKNQNMWVWLTVLFGAALAALAAGVPVGIVLLLALLIACPVMMYLMMGMDRGPRAPQDRGSQRDRNDPDRSLHGRGKEDIR